MASFQRVALFILFNAMEQDLTNRLRELEGFAIKEFMTEDERAKTLERVTERVGRSSSDVTDFELIQGLDFADKFQVFMRNKRHYPIEIQSYYSGLVEVIKKAVPIRNATMHGRPLTTIQYALGFSIATELIQRGKYWPTLKRVYDQYTSNPAAFVGRSVQFLDDGAPSETLHNLPSPDYDDTGFLPRPKLEKELKAKILGRHPVITVLGEGGSGKTALTLQTLYSLADTNDHDFDAIIWVSAKSHRLSLSEISRIEGAITDSLGVFKAAADILEPGDDEPMKRLRNLMSENKILLCIDNLETVVDASVRDFAADVPGQSKIVFTSRVPLGSDLSVLVEDFSEADALSYIYRLCDAYSINRLKTLDKEVLTKHIKRLNCKPLLLKWFALGVSSGADPAAITRNPDLALNFCLENVVEKLSDGARRVGGLLSILPKSASTGVLSYLSEMTPTVTEAALAELLRFALVSQVDLEGVETSYHLRPFAKAYLTRVTGLKGEDTTEVLAKYRSLEAMYHTERANEKRNRYDSRNFIVRSPAEMLAAKQLRAANDLLLGSEIPSAQEKIDQVKITCPDYFEAYRVEAFLGYKSGESSRATDSYETALELAPDQPQLHFWYAGYLMRTLSDFERADKHFSRAMELDPGRKIVLREAARNKFFIHEYDEAEELLAILMNEGFHDLKDEVITTDLWVQLHSRKAENLFSRGAIEDAAAQMRKLFAVIRSFPFFKIDPTLLDHISRCDPIIEKIKSGGYVDDMNILTTFSQWIQYIKDRKSNYERDSSGVIYCVGTLKAAGQKESYGFLRDQEGVETFIHRDDMAAETWEKLKKGSVARYAVVDVGGRKRAANVEIAT